MNKFCSAILRIASKVMNAREISRAIGVDATECHDIGEVLSLKSPRPKNREETLWLFKSCISEDLPLEEHIKDLPLEEHIKDLPLEEHIKDLLFFSETKSQELGSIASKCDIEVFCSFASTNGQGGFVLDHVLLQRLAKSKIDFVFDLYLTEGFPKGTIIDPAHADRVLVPVGNAGKAVYQIGKNGTAKLKTTLIAK